jgi:hypothetical protein
MKTATALLFLLTSPALGASFDGVWQSAGEQGNSIRYMIRGDEVRFYHESDGQFIEETACSIGIERKGNSAILEYHECNTDDGLIALKDRIRLTVKDANTIHVRYEPFSGKPEKDRDWIRVR